MKVLLWCRFVLQFRAFNRSVSQGENRQLYDLRCVAVCEVLMQPNKRPYQGCALAT